MRVLIVSSGNSKAGISPFVYEQSQALVRNGCVVEHYLIKRRGFVGYYQSLLELHAISRSKKYDIIHAHYIWSIIVSLFTVNSIKIGTFHGSDLSTRSLVFLAKCLVLPFVNAIVVVNSQMAQKLGNNSKVHIIPCGVETSVFYPREASNTRTVLKVLQPNVIKVLFPSRFDRHEKNYPLAKVSVSIVERKYPINLIELVGFSRNEVAELLNTVDAVLLTSLWEGSPQVVKEAMACNCPVVSTDVGDVRWLLEGVSNSFVCKSDKEDIARAIMKIASSREKSNGSARIKELELSNINIAKRLIELYQNTLSARSMGQ